MGLLGTPIPQRHRPIALSLLHNNALLWSHVFYPRPEEMTFSHPAAATVKPTLGGAWVDDFGKGIEQITIEGHTGWRGGFGIPGELKFLNLRKLIIDQYRDLRNVAVLAGQDPNTVELLLLDTLNLYAAIVYPMDFQLKRNKNRPLLFIYQLKLIVLGGF